MTICSKRGCIELVLIVNINVSAAAIIVNAHIRDTLEKFFVACEKYSLNMSFSSILCYFLFKLLLAITLMSKFNCAGGFTALAVTPFASESLTSFCIEDR